MQATEPDYMWKYSGTLIIRMPAVCGRLSYSAPYNGIQDAFK